MSAGKRESRVLTSLGSTVKDKWQKTVKFPTFDLEINGLDARTLRISLKIHRKTSFGNMHRCERRIWRCAASAVGVNDS